MISLGGVSGLGTVPRCQNQAVLPPLHGEREHYGYLVDTVDTEV